MNFEPFSTLLFKAFEDNQLPPLSETQARQFHQLTLHLLRTNEQMNLTAIKDIPSVITKHYVDSCMAAEHIRQSASLLDIGCGAGFPTLPLAIYRPDIKITAMDSTDKKVLFVKSTAEMLGCENVATISGRAEDRSVLKTAGLFDCVTSRAVSRLPILCEISVPYIKQGGKMIALKGADGAIELSEAKHCISILGCQVEAFHEKELHLLDGSSETRSIILLKKLHPTPHEYPRAYAAIKKKPL